MTRFLFLLCAVACDPPGEAGPDAEAPATATVVGEKGPEGPRGDAGPAGPQGEPGPIGADGPEGPVGPKGPDGEAGPAGPAGETGPTGPRGADGPQGPAGPKGPPGDEGEPGLPGGTGPKGHDGPLGAPGDDGPNGPKGFKGRPGDDGVPSNLVDKTSLYERSARLQVAPSSGLRVEALCADVNDVVISGSCDIGTALVTQLGVVDARPINVTSAVANAGWRCEVENHDTVQRGVTVQVLCIDIP